MKRLAADEIGKFPHKNVIVRALGMKETVQVDLAERSDARSTTRTCCAPTGCRAWSTTPGLRTSSQEEQRPRHRVRAADPRRQSQRRAGQHHLRAGSSRTAVIPFGVTIALCSSPSTMLSGQMTTRSRPRASRARRCARRRRRAARAARPARSIALGDDRAERRRWMRQRDGTGDEVPVALQVALGRRVLVPVAVVADAFDALAVGERGQVAPGGSSRTRPSLAGARGGAARSRARR